MKTEHPFLMHDHTFVYYNAVVGRQALRNSGLMAAYDPNFMSGYAHSWIGSTNIALPVAMLLVPEEQLGRAYKIYVLAVIISLPFFVFASARLLDANCRLSDCAAMLWIVHFWSGQGNLYAWFGMLAFWSSIAWALLLTALVERFFRNPGKLTAVPMAFAAIATLMTHPVATLVLAPPYAAAWIYYRNRLEVKQHLMLIVAIICTVAANAFWLLPGLALWSTKGAIPEFYTNPNVLQRLAELISIREACLPILLVGTLTCVWFRALKAPAYWLTTCWVFILAFPAGYLADLVSLQLGRHLETLSAFAVLPALLGYRELLASRRPAVLLLTFLYIAIPALDTLFRCSSRTGRYLGAELTPTSKEFLSDVRQWCPPESRLFFEECNAYPTDRFAGYRLSGILPQELGREIIGGPWLFTHYKTNHCQVGDGKFFKDSLWNVDRLVHFAQTYRARFLVCWSEESLRAITAAPGNFEIVASAGLSPNLRLYLVKIVRALDIFDSRKIELSARLNEISVRIPAHIREPIVLPYHLVPGMTVEPPCKMSGTYQVDDPVPFITLHDPPEHVVIKFSPWRLF